jgi:hypothetical protein
MTPICTSLNFESGLPAAKSLPGLDIIVAATGRLLSASLLNCRLE